MNSRWLVIKQLDKQMKEWQSVNARYGFPRAGWIKTVRVALCMSVIQLASRLNVTRASVTSLEKAELRDAITLRKLKEVAEALECEFVYAFVPKGRSSLESIVKERVEQIATERMTRVAHTMSLEAQSVNAGNLKEQKEQLMKNLMARVDKNIWESVDHEKSGSDKETLLKKLIKGLKNKK